MRAEPANQAVLAGLALLMLAPLAFMPIDSAEPFKVPAELVIVSGAWVLIGAIAMIVPRVRLGAAQKWFLCLLGWLGVTTALAVNPASSVGYLTSVATYFVLGFALVAWLENAEHAVRGNVVKLLAGLVAVQTVLGYIQMAGVDLSGWGNRVAPGTYFAGYMAVLGATTGARQAIGTLGNLNYLAEFLALTCPVLLCWALAMRRSSLRVLAILAMLAPFALIVATACRAAILGLLVGIPIAAVVALGWRALDPRGWVASREGRYTVVGVGLGVGASVAYFGRHLWAKIRDLGSGDIDVIQRIVNWQAGIAIWRDHLLSGAGLGGFKLLDVEKLRQLNPHGLPTATASTRFYQAHNETVQTLAELGSVGAFFAIMALADWGKEVAENPTLARTERFGLVWGLTALIVASCFGFPFHIPLTALALVIVVALGLARPDEEPEAAVIRPWAPVVAAILAAVCIRYGVWPLYVSSLDQQLGAKAADGGRYAEAAAYYERARQANRFKAAIITQQLLALYHDRQYLPMITLFDQNVREGLGMDAVTMKADALSELGRKDEAIALYVQVMHYYSPDHPNYRRASSQLAHFQAEQAASAGALTGHFGRN